MCGVKLQWWVDAFEGDAKDKDIIPTSQQDNESSC